ncbi:hypothetical protein BDN70DRAFT_925204 [Pholiota conissans]|uniref:F-box domain-containing protein n=1 Tax=Pholiota conissans TaxID=109636 RepID=A0A9P5YTA8_9AGAR|nr:hypothetical protein BDN70DRAFT_925204 [Pholiota conissans]
MTTSPCPIGNMPYDILQEIFCQYLPQYPLQHLNSIKYPMILCRVCSFWRMVALSSPTLWSHLRYSITLRDVDLRDRADDCTVLKRDLEFLQWYKRNQGSIPPFLYISYIDADDNTYVDEDFGDEESLDFVHWSGLTHISMVHTSISVSFLFSILRAAPRLQWGYFNLGDMDEDADAPEQYTPAHLHTLCITFSDESELSLLFTGLHLPALETLYLCGGTDAWLEKEVITHLNEALKYTPNLRKLALGSLCLSFGFHPFESYVFTPSPDIEPIWKYTPRLEHVELEMPLTNYMKPAGEELEDGVSQILRGCYKWMDFENPACPIRTITIVFDELADVTEEARATIRNCKNNVSHIDLQFTSKMIEHAASQLWLDWAREGR